LTILSLSLMGGNMFFPWAPAHEIIGVLLIVVWAVHVYANRRWFKAVFRGRYNPYRIVQMVVNCGMLICAVFLAISGVMLSNHVFAFLGIESGASFARTAHLLASHWYFVFIALHIGLHVNVIFSRLGVARIVMKSRAALVVSRVAVALVSAYGVYAFIERGLWKYLTLQQPFFFMDLESGYALFFVDYIAMIVAFAVAIIFVSSLIRLRQRG
ncbi:MAG: DUF4405 domain-containing protein, partial [Fibrobacter sp.]|nr:DUF4405 domain-containing protein [Fibrobacter sp.]